MSVRSPPHVVVDDRQLACVTVCADAERAIAHIAQAGPGRPRPADPRG